MKSSQIYKGSKVQTARVRQLSEGKCDTLLAAATIPISFAGGKEASLLAGYVKPGFHMIVPIAPVVSKYLETILTTGAIGSFHMIVSIASKARDAGSSAMSLG